MKLASSICISAHPPIPFGTHTMTIHYWGSLFNKLYFFFMLSLMFLLGINISFFCVKKENRISGFLGLGFESRRWDWMNDWRKRLKNEKIQSCLDLIWFAFNFITRDVCLLVVRNFMSLEKSWSISISPHVTISFGTFDKITKI